MQQNFTQSENPPSGQQLPPFWVVIARSSRLPFLLLTPVCVLLGAALAFSAGSSINVPLLMLVLSGAIFAHISVNTLNEYSDYRSGLDFNTQRTPFSGGSGALPESPERANAVLLAGIVSLLAVIVIGGFLINQLGLKIAPIGVAGILLIVFYTGLINRIPLLCLIAPGLGFGVLMVIGTQLVLHGSVTPATGFAVILPFMLINNLLLLNQFPDIEADRKVGRQHYPIVRGIRFSSWLYALAAMCGFVSIIGGVTAGTLPTLAFIALIPLPLAGYAFYGAQAKAARIGESPQYLAANTALSLLSPALLTAALFFG